MEQQFYTHLQQSDAVLVCVAATQGSVPREAGAWMAVFGDKTLGSIGGGHLEHQALATARSLLGAAASATTLTQRYALGPSLGQCCGGVVYLEFQRVGVADLARLRPVLHVERVPVALFGAGHVGSALAQLLSSLPFSLTWIDSRDNIFPPAPPLGLVCEQAQPLQSAVAGLAAGTLVLIMSFSHAEDWEVLLACLQRQRRAADLPYLGLIGSATKWASFRRRLQQRGFTPEALAHVTCPIGVPGIDGKAPEVIAVAVAAQLLQQPALRQRGQAAP